MPLALMDAALLAMETPVTPLHVGAGSLFRRPAGAGSDWVQRLHARWSRSPVNRAPFNFRLASAPLAAVRPRWEVLDSVDLGQHFFRVALPRPGDDAELERLIARLHSRHLDRSRPLWEIYLIEGFSDHRFAMYTKIHHALADGATVIRIFGDQFSENPNARAMPPVWTAPRQTARRSPPAHVANARPRPSASPRDPSDLLAGASNGVERVASVLRNLSKMSQLAQTRAPDTIFNRPMTARREIGHAVFDFARVKTLSRTLDCTINDVALAACSGALRRYLQSIHALPDEALVGSIPVSLNRAGNARGGNAVTAVMVSLHTDVADPRRRFQAIRESMREIKSRLAELPPEAIEAYTAIALAPVMIEQLTGRWTLRHRAHNVVISNVPGPRTRLYTSGAEFLGAIPVPMILRGTGLNITLVSLVDRIWFSYMTCPDIAPHVERLGPFIAESLAELETVISRRPHRAQRPTRAAGARRRLASPATVP